MKQPRLDLPFLVVADETQAAELQALLGTLPLCASGRVFVECASAEDAFELDAPARMTVTWLARDIRSGAPGTADRCARGEAIARAVTAWALECVDDTVAERLQVYLLGEYRTVSSAHEALAEHTAVTDDRIVVDEVYRLRRTPS